VIAEVDTEITVGVAVSPKLQDTLTLFPLLVDSPGKLVNGALRPTARGIQVQEVTRMDNTLRLILLKECADVGHGPRVMLRDVSVRDKGYGIGRLCIVLHLVASRKKSAKPTAS
jgi:hypothetical protein